MYICQIYIYEKKKNIYWYSKRGGLNHFSRMSYFYIPWKHQKSFRFMTFSEGIEMEHLANMGPTKSQKRYSKYFLSKEEFSWDRILKLVNIRTKSIWINDFLQDTKVMNVYKMLYGSRHHMVHIDSEINVNRLENIAKTLSTSMFRLFCKWYYFT